MGKFRLPLNNFLLGEVSSKFYGRYDLKDISQACRSLLNSFVRPQGGAFRRPGTRFVTHQGRSRLLGNTPSFHESVKLIPWTINKTESYVMILVSETSYDDNTKVGINFYRLSDDTVYGIYQDANTPIDNDWKFTVSQLQD